MTLRQFHSDLLFKNYPIGVQGKDPQNDTLWRDKIIGKLNYSIKDAKKEPSVYDANIWCREEIDKRGKSIDDIIKATESRIAETQIMLKQTEKDGSDKNPYEMAIKAYENFLTYLKEK